MTASSPNDSVFHDVGSLFPEEVEPCCVSPGTTVGDALRLMARHRYSQVPVVEDERVRGVFSLWSLAQHVVDYPGVPDRDLSVEDVMGHLPSVTAKDSLDDVLTYLDRNDAVLVESGHGLQAVATMTDILRYFYRIARPFVLLQEIELALRDLIAACTRDGHLTECIDRGLRKKYEGMKRPLPTDLHEMSLEDYRSIICTKENWPLFQGVLGRNKDLVASKLERVRKIRNDIFHFRDGVSVDDHETLAAERHWLFDKVEALRGRPQPAVDR